MDPNANLDEQLRLANKILRSDKWTDADAERLAELVEALDGWIDRGGFLPQHWSIGR